MEGTEIVAIVDRGVERVELEFGRLNIVAILTAAEGREQTILQGSQVGLGLDQDATLFIGDCTVRDEVEVAGSDQRRAGNGCNSEFDIFVHIASILKITHLD